MRLARLVVKRFTICREILLHTHHTHGPPVSVIHTDTHRVRVRDDTRRLTPSLLPGTDGDPQHGFHSSTVYHVH